MTGPPNGNRLLLWDNHACIRLTPEADSAAQLARWHQAGFSFVSINIGFGDMPYGRHIEMAEAVTRWVEEHPDAYLMARCADDVARAFSSRRTAVAFDVEGAAMLGGDLSRLEALHALGVRWFLFAYNKSNAAAGGCQDRDDGLTAYGRDLLQGLEEVGIVPCCSHAGRRTALEILELARGPVIFSHSNPAALKQHPRNIDDELIRRCGQTGGVVGLNGISFFLRGGISTPDVLADHILYVIEVAGSDHVGIGLDFAADPEELKAFLENAKHLFPPELGYDQACGMVPPEGVLEVAAALRRRNLPEADIRKVMGSNFFRVASRCWR